MSVTAERRGSDVVVDVSDTGQGFPADIAPRIFEVFVQGPRTIDRREGGLGLGLASRGASLSSTTDASKHGAMARAAAARSPYICPPAHLRSYRRKVPEPGAPAHTRVATPADRRRQSRRGGDAVDVHDRQRARRGHRPRRSTGAETLPDVQPEIAVLDIGLPVMDGYELARRIRDATGPGGPVLVAVTGYGQAEDVERSRAAGSRTTS